MSTEYKLSYTAADIDERLGKVMQLSEDTEKLATDVQSKAEVVTLTTAEYEALESTNVNTLYMLTDSEDSIPSASVNDEGKFLRIVNGSPAWVTIASASETTF